MSHIYLTQEIIQESLVTGVITYKEANELTTQLERCAKTVAKSRTIRHKTVTRHMIA